MENNVTTECIHIFFFYVYFTESKSRSMSLRFKKNINILLTEKMCSTPQTQTLHKG